MWCELNPCFFLVCCLLLQDLRQSCSRGGRRIVEGMYYEIRRSEACVDYSDHHALGPVGEPGTLRQGAPVFPGSSRRQLGIALPNPKLQRWHLWILFRNGELNLLWPDSGCPLQAGTGHGRPGRVPGRCGCAVTSLLQRDCGAAVWGPFWPPVPRPRLLQPLPPGGVSERDPQTRLRISERNTKPTEIKLYFKFPTLWIHLLVFVSWKNK